MRNSALSDNQRYSILSNELIRRLSNTNHVDQDMEDVHNIIETLIQELKNSGYNRKYSREIVVFGILGWKRKIARRIQEGKPLYRSAPSSLAQRCRKKLTEKTSWYKNKRKREDDADGGQNKKLCAESRNRASQAEYGHILPGGGADLTLPRQFL